VTNNYQVSCSSCNCETLYKNQYGFQDTTASAVSLILFQREIFLEQFGTTLDQATQQGRLFLHRPYACCSCGHWDYYNALKCPDIAKVSRVWLIGSAFPLLMYLFYFTSLHHILALGLALLFCILCVLGKTILLRRHLRKADHVSDPFICKNCQSPDLVSLIDLPLPLTCPDCGKQTCIMEPCA